MVYFNCVLGVLGFDYVKKPAGLAKSIKITLGAFIGDLWKIFMLMVPSLCYVNTSLV